MLHFANWVTLETGQCKWLLVTLRATPADAEGSHQLMLKHRVCCADCNSRGDPWDADRQMVCEWRRRNTSGNCSLGFAEVSSGPCDTQRNTHPVAWEVVMKIRNLHRYLETASNGALVCLHAHTQGAGKEEWNGAL